MREIGGYIEFEHYDGPMLHGDAIALNSGRNCLAYLIRARKIRKIKLPYFLCDSVKNICNKEGVQISYYKINEHFLPSDTSIEDDEWLYIVNYYGQLSQEYIKGLKEKCDRIIVDHAQGYFQMPIEGVDTLYTCRKYFGVVDGAFLYTDVVLNEELETDISFDRMRFVLGRFEKTASEFYEEYVENNHMFSTENIKRMSKLTNNLLHGIDYEKVKSIRLSNFNTLHNAFSKFNKLKLANSGTFMYPLYVHNGKEIRKALQANKIYIPLLWPDVLKVCEEDGLEYDMANNLLPLPIDQRYDEYDMRYVINEVKKWLN